MPDRNHVHHKLLELGLPQVWVVIVLVAFNVLMIACSLIFAEIGTHRLVLIEIGAMILLGILLEVIASFKTDDHATTM